MCIHLLSYFGLFKFFGGQLKAALWVVHLGEGERWWRRRSFAVLQFLQFVNLFESSMREELIYLINLLLKTFQLCGRQFVKGQLVDDCKTGWYRRRLGGHWTLAMKLLPLSFSLQVIKFQGLIFFFAGMTSGVLDDDLMHRVQMPVSYRLLRKD